MRLLAIGVTAFLVIGSSAAEAARCPLGKVYRPTQGVCQSKQAAIRQGVYRPKTNRVPRATTRPSSGAAHPDVVFHNHLHDWVVRNRQRLIRHGESL